MLRKRRLLLVVAVGAVSAACGSPTAPGARLARPALDGGYGLGSGNRDSSTVRTSSTDTTQAGISSTSASTGYGLGSGN
jgi:hypothetical protein